MGDRWQAIASGRPAPAIDPLALQQEIYDALTAGSGISPVEQLVEDWYDLARQCGITVHDEHGDLRPDIDDAITRTVITSIWFGITVGYLTLTGRYHIPRKFLYRYPAYSTPPFAPRRSQKALGATDSDLQ